MTFCSKVYIFKLEVDIKSKLYSKLGFAYQKKFKLIKQ